MDVAGTFLYKVTPGAQAPLASDLNQIIDALNGAFDFGTITLAAPINPPATAGISATAVSGSGLGIGAYMYKFTYVVGYQKSDRTFVYGGETNGSASVSVTTTSGNQAVSISGLPTTWPSTAVALRIYRTAVGGADGTQKLVTTLTAPQASYTDTTPDASLTVAAPTTNTTGSAIAIPNLASMPSVGPANTLCIVNNTLYISNGTQWVAISGGGGGSNTLTNPLYRLNL